MTLKCVYVISVRTFCKMNLISFLGCKIMCFAVRNLFNKFNN